MNIQRSKSELMNPSDKLMKTINELIQIICKTINFNSLHEI